MAHAVISSQFTIVITGPIDKEKPVVIAPFRSYQVVHAFVTTQGKASIDLIRVKSGVGEDEGTCFANLLVPIDPDTLGIERPMKIVDPAASHIGAACVTVISVGYGVVDRVVLHCIGSPSQPLALE